MRAPVHLSPRRGGLHPGGRRNSPPETREARLRGPNEPAEADFPRSQPGLRRSRPRVRPLRRWRAAALALLALAAAASGAAAQQKINRRLAVAPDAYIKVWTPGGSLRVVGWDRDSVAVVGAAGAGTGRFMFGGDRSAVKMGFEETGEGAAQLELRVPLRSTVWVKTATADLEVSGLAGAVDLYSVSGRIRVAGTLRQLFAESMGGDLELNATAASLRAKTGGGAITLRGTGDDVTLTTVEGSISVAGPRFRRGRFESISGSIAFQGEVERGASLLFQTHSGGVELRLPAASGVDFGLSSYAGELRSDFPLPRAAGKGALRGRELTFSSGKGGADVTVRTYSGPITLRRQ